METLMYITYTIFFATLLILMALALIALVGLATMELKKFFRARSTTLNGLNSPRLERRN